MLGNQKIDKIDGDSLYDDSELCARMTNVEQTVLTQVDIETV